VRDLIAVMTWEEKLSQLRIVYRPALADAAEVVRRGVGAVFWPQSAHATNELQRVALNETRLGIPLLVALDVIHGHRTIVPTPLALAASFDPELVRRCASLAAAEARSEGVNWTFSPMVDVTRDPRWGRVVEGFGEDVLLTATMGRAMIAGYQGDDLAASDALAATAKHFVAYGEPEGGRDYNTVDASPHRLRNVHLEPFRAAVDAGVAAVMASFNTVAGQPMHVNRALLTDVLKDEWGFGGLVVGDAEGVPNLLDHRVAESLGEALRMAHEAGLDVEMGGAGFAVDADDLRPERIDAARVDDAVARILMLKERLGLFERPFVDVPPARPESTKEARGLARTAAARAAVLLRNDGTLPLGPEARVLLTGPYATSTDHLGAWTHSFATPSSDTVADAFAARVGEDRVVAAPGVGFFGGDEAGIVEVEAATSRADVAVVLAGEPSTISGEAASRSDIRLPGAQEELIRRVAATGLPTVVVLLTGRPLDVSAWIDDVAAAVVAWHGGTEAAAAIVDVLAGDVDPAGRLPMTFPRAVGQVPIYYAHENTGRPARVRGALDAELIDIGVHGPDNVSDKYTSKYLDLDLGPRFAFGHGGSYATFRHDPPRVSSSMLSLAELRQEAVSLEVGVTNTSERAGDEVLLVFVEDLVARVAPPVRRLVAFERVRLEPGEERGVSFSLGFEALSYWREDSGRFERVVEPGRFRLHVGPTLQKTVVVDLVVTGEPLHRPDR
jgi:beta-glucosidase